MSISEPHFAVRVEPIDIVLECRPNETLIQCAWRNGYYWPTICGGRAECGACRCELTEGHRFAAPLTAAESVFVSNHTQQFPPGRIVRLACCMTVTGPMTVLKEGVRPK